MEWKKAKNIIILLLAAVNIFLLLNLYSLKSGEHNSLEEAALGTAAYLESKGIYVDSAVIPRESAKRQSMVIERSSDAEIATASALVGGSNVTDAGGTITVTGTNGSATWRSGSLLDADITVSGIYNSGDPAVLIAYLESAGINTAGYIISSDEVGFVLTLNKIFNGEKVMNCNLVIRCESDDRATISGRWFTGDGIALNDSTELESAGLIIKYVEHMEKIGMTINSIESIENGYVAQQMTKIGIILLPVLKITSDGIGTYINAIDGNIVLNEINS